MDASRISVSELQAETSPSKPLIVDVRADDDYARADAFLSGALRRSPSEPDWDSGLPINREIVVYCERGGEVSRRLAAGAGSTGRVRFLEGGLAAWLAGGGAVLPKPSGGPSRWVTRERPKIDRIACPWLIARFIDRDAEIQFVKASDVLSVAEASRAIPFDVPDVTFSHDGERCSFDAFLRIFRLEDEALGDLALIIRGADTGHLELTPQSAGLLAVSLGLSRLFTSDQEMMKHGFTVYDALYLWAREGRGETHTWNPGLYR